MIKIIVFFFLLSPFIYGQDSTYYDINFDDRIPRNYNLKLQNADLYNFQSNPSLPLDKRIKLLAKVISFRPKNKNGRKATLYRDSIVQVFVDSLKRTWKFEWVGSSYLSEGRVPLVKDNERIIFKEDVMIQTKNKEEKVFPYKVSGLGVDSWNDIFLVINFDDSSWVVYIDKAGIGNRMASIRVPLKKDKKFLCMHQRWVSCGGIEMFGSRSTIR